MQNSCTMHAGIIALFSILLVSPVLCWDSVEMEVFDVVEEVNENFYELMGISNDAELSDIKKAYRSLSKQIHPDKSDAPDAEIKFRQLVSVYEVLKDPERRGHYDRVLVDGLPDWRSAVYYYRRARKMSMIEIFLILILVISVSQYLMAWGSYWDTYQTVDEALSRKYKRSTKQKKKATDGAPNPVEEELAKIPKPSMLHVLPVQVCRGSYYILRNGPSLLREYREERERRILEAEEDRILEEEETKQLQEEEEQRKARKAAPKRRKQVAVPEFQETVKKEPAVVHTQDYMSEEPAAAGYTTGMWSHEEFCELTKLMSKYPGGTLDRWEVISEQLNRAPHEVTKMAVKMRDRLAAGTWLQEQEVTVQTKLKTKTRSTAPDTDSCSDQHWSSVQQRALERSLKAHPKGTDQRWDKIAKQVPEKTADDCICRFKFLAERIRKKKEEEEESAKLATQRDIGDCMVENDEENTKHSEDDDDDTDESNR